MTDALKGIARARALAQLLQAKAQSLTAKGLEKAKLVKSILDLRNMLGFGKEDLYVTVPADPREPAEGDARISTAEYFSVRVKGSTSRQKLNDEAVAVLKRLEANPEATISEADKFILAKYTGNGGGLIGADGLKGSAYEYYTPKPIAEGIWEILQDNGFAGGKVLAPSAGTGIFGATAPLNAAVDSVELSEVSGRINQIINGGTGYTVTISPFERVAAATPDRTYDAVVTNVPFGEKADRGTNYLLDEKYQDEPLENYFILRSLEKLRPNGMAAFIVPTRCISGKDGKQASLRERASLMAEFVGGYRLPTGTFSSADTDTVTDVMFFRKFSDEVAEKIEELRAQNPAVLTEAKVLWEDFIEGNYFKTAEGHPYVLGEFVARDPNKFRDVDKVLNNASINELKDIMREKKLPRSRIGWELLNATETEPIVYNEGDHITQAGVTLEMRNGVWVALPKTESDTGVAQVLAKCANPYKAFESKVSLDQAMGLIEKMEATSQSLDIPVWLAGVKRGLADFGENDRKKHWKKALVALSVEQVLEERSDESDVNFSEEYKVLTEAMRTANITQADVSKVKGNISNAYRLARIHYTKKNGYSDRWLGKIKETVSQSDEIVQAAGTPESIFANKCYTSKTPWQTIETAKEVFGESFDPLSDDAWCISGDGKTVCRVDDYFVGNYGQFLARIDAEIEAAGDEKIKAKLLRQRILAAARVQKVDTSRLSFNLHSPYVTAQEKVMFLKAFVTDAAVESTDENGRALADIQISNPKTDKEKLLNRMGDYLMKGTVTLGGVKLETMEARDGLLALSGMIASANEQFNAWVKSNKTIMARMEKRASDPEKLRFSAAEDESELSIPGMKPEIKLHGYQCSYVRKMGREFGGINGFGVGLGKTFTALAAVQHVQAIGVKKKTLFVVPNSVLSNWKKEAGRAYATLDDCLFVGLRTNKAGKAVVNSSAYDEDLHEIVNNRHSKIFMTMEAFERIKLRNETIDDYMAYLRTVDNSIALSESKKDDERKKGKAAGYAEILRKKTGAAPYLEDLGIDSIVIDEAHMYKNSAQTYEFKGARYLPEATASRRGIDAQAKAWYVRGGSTLGDGVLMLTATPITNSPIEIYSMLSLAVGQERVNDACLGIHGADDFMKTMCMTTTEETTRIDGSPGMGSVFTGLDNLDVLRKSLGDVATIKSAEDVGASVVIPDRDEKATVVSMTTDMSLQMERLKEAYRYASDLAKERQPDPAYAASYESVQAEFGEPVEIIAHPFNLIKKMTALIADPELVTGESFYQIQRGEEELARKVIDEFNAKKFKEERNYMAPDKLVNDQGNIKITTKKDGDVEVETYTLTITGRLMEGEVPQICIDSTNFKVQSALEDIAAKHGLELDVHDSPKLSAMLENFKNEMAHPRGMIDAETRSPIVKQIIFCDMLGLHSKIRRLLQKRCGISAGKIAIVTGQTNNTPEEIQGVQDGFNAQGEDNRFQVIIANEKAEVGINLQKGTQAIHHLTIGWTPDSLEQRNGRGARQSNKTQMVRIYYYDADGSFDVLKRKMVNSKNDWISNVTDLNGGSKVTVTGGLSNEDYDALIRSAGDPEAMKRYEEEKQQREALARAQGNRERQRVNLDTIAKQTRFLSKYDEVSKLAVERVTALWTLDNACAKLQKKVEKPNPRPSDLKKYAALQAMRDAKAEELDSCIKFFHTESYGEEPKQLENAMAMIETVNSGWRVPKNAEDAARYIGSDRYRLDVDSTSSLYGEWQSLVEQAKGMIEQSAASYEEQAKEEGALPSGMAQAVREGNAEVVNGHAIMVGMFFRDDDCLSLVYGRSRWGEWNVVSRGYDGSSAYRYLRNDGSQKFIYPGTPEYDECLVEAAEIEDGIATKGEVFSDFSDHCQAVLQYRKTEKLVEYSCDTASLPSPYFPYVVTSEEMMACPACAAVGREQADIVKSRSGSRFTVEATVDVNPNDMSGNWRGRNQRFVEALVVWARAHNLKATFNYSSDGWRFFAKDKLADADFSGLQDAKSDLEIDAYINRRVSELLPDVDFESVEQVIPENVKILVQKRKADLLPDDKIVGLAGDTYQYKDDIKALSLSSGERAKWDGYRKAWIVPYVVYKKLIERYPNAVNRVEIVAAA